MKEQMPGGEAFPLAARRAEQRQDAVRLGDFRNAWLARHQRRQPIRHIRNPGANRHGKTLLSAERLAGRKILREPLAQQILAPPITNLELVRQAKGSGGHAGIKKGRAAFNPMRHQAAIKLDQQIMRQPIGAIGRLRDLQAGSPWQRRGGFGGVSGLQSYLDNEGIALVIDATHPFAAQMSRQAFEACQRCGVLLLRFERKPWEPNAEDDWTVVGSAAEAAAALPPGARVLLTTGRKDLEFFFARPDLSGIARMIEEPPMQPPSGWRVLRERPPFTVAGEAALMSENAISHLVTKNAGGSATEAKLEAAREGRIPVLMIARPVKPEVPNFGSLDNRPATRFPIVLAGT